MENSTERQELECNHSICTTCLKKVVKGKNDVACPHCKVINHLKQCDDTYVSSNTSGKCPLDMIERKCTQCDENNAAIKFCKECKESICNECTNAHKRTKLTKNHELIDIVRDEVRSENILDQDYCKVEQHSDCVVKSYCTKCKKEICEKCAKEKHTGHQIKSLKEVVKEKENELKCVVQEIKQKGHHNMKEILEKKSARTKEIEKQMKDGLARQFDNYAKVLKKRCDILQNQVEQKAKEYLENVTYVLRNMQDKLKESEHLTNEKKNAMTFIRSCRELIKDLKRCERNTKKLPQEFDLRYSQVCTTDDFEKLVNALGSIQESKHPSLNGHEEQVESLSSGLNSQATAVLTGESSARNQFMDVLKSLTMSEHVERPLPELSYRSSTANSSRELQSINNETSTIQNVKSSRKEKIPNPVIVIEKNLPKHKREMLQLDSVKAMVDIRLETWGLNGSWGINEDRVEVLSRSQEDADHCMQLLNETVLEKTIPLRKDSKFIVESDKWQIMTRILKKKFQEQVQIDINHADSEVIVYSSSLFILKDSCDVIRLFLRDNQVKKVTLHYDERVVAFIMKSKSQLKKICESFSQYCLDISTVNNTSISLKGIGFGVDRAIQRVNMLASKFAKSSEEDRFDSDNSDTDEGERFSDDDDGHNDHDAAQVESKVDVQINLVIEDETEADVRAICFPGDDRMLYVVAGNIINLPVEALVNAADRKLKHNGGLAKALVKKGGRSIQEECTYHVENNGNVEIGQVFCSGAGNFASSVIIHAVGPKWIDGKQKETEKLFECITNCLKSASKLKLASIAFPAISAGTYKFPIKNATLTIIRALKDFLQHEPRCSIREIYFCDRDINTTNEFVSSVKDIFHDDDIVLSGGQIPPKDTTRVIDRRNDERQMVFI